MAGGDLDEIAEHVVVLDLERSDARAGRVFGLERADEAAAFVAQLALFVERGGVAFGDEAAVAGVRRRVGGRARGPAGRQARRGRRGAARRRRGRRAAGARPVSPASARRRRSASARSRASRNAARSRGPPRPRPQAPQRAFDVGAAREGVARGVSGRGVGDEEGHHVEPRADGRRVGQRGRQARGEQPPAAGGARAVDRVEQAAAAPAVEGAHQFEVAPRRRVDGHGRAVGLAARRGQARLAPFLCDLEIVDERAGGGGLGARKGSERLQRRDAPRLAQAAFGGGGVEAHWRQQGGGLRPFGEFTLLREGFGDEGVRRAQPARAAARARRRPARRL